MSLLTSMASNFQPQAAFTGMISRMAAMMVPKKTEAKAMAKIVTGSLSTTSWMLDSPDERSHRADVLQPVGLSAPTQGVCISDPKPQLAWCESEKEGQ